MEYNFRGVALYSIPIKILNFGLAKPNKTDLVGLINWFFSTLPIRLWKAQPLPLLATISFPKMSLLLRTLPLRHASFSLFLSATAISASNAAVSFLLPKPRSLPRRRTFCNSAAAAAASADAVAVKSNPSPPSVLKWVSRTGLCGELSVEDVGKRVHLCGWVALHRVHGGLTFLNLRDHTGIVQVSQSHLKFDTLYL